MMTISVPVLNSLVFIQDERSQNPPAISGVGRFWRTATAVAISCLPDSEGETELTLLDPDALPEWLVCIFDEMIEAPSGWLTVETLADNIHFREPIGSGSARVRVWTDGHQASSVVAICIGSDK